MLAVAFAVSLAASVFTLMQVNKETDELSKKLRERTLLLADGLAESAAPAYARYATSTLEKLANTFTNRERLIGLAFYDTRGNKIAGSSGVTDEMLKNAPILDTFNSTEPDDAFAITEGTRKYYFAQPLHSDDAYIGSLVLVQDASDIDVAMSRIWRDTFLKLFVYFLLFAVAIAALVYFVLFKPLSNLAESIRQARMNKDARAPQPSHHNFFLQPLAMEVSKLASSLAQARTAASEEARMRLEKIDTPWTEERLKEFIKAYLKDRPIYVVSNREPYIHSKDRGEVTYSVPASGMVTALESVMAACGGEWLAHGSGNADKEMVDAESKIRVPPDEPKYTLKRIWLNPKEVKGYYVGFSNEALWPLCHIAHTRPTFRKEDWLMYKRVNGKFAEALLAELKGVERPIVLIQDFHLSLLPRMIKESRPDAQVGLFWHIPWPSAEGFSICPWRKEILQGMLGADIIGFHTQQFCNNFLETVGKEIESLIDLEQFAVTSDEHTSFIKPFPISISFTDAMEGKTSIAPDRAALEAMDIRTEFVGLGVDRLDYTKGILERFRGIEFFLDAHPDFYKRFTFLQVAPPSREESEKYRDYAVAVEAEAARVNAKFRKNGWQPIRFEKRHFSHSELVPLYQTANFCLVTSLHDGMNLVAKEYVAARDDEAGALILSKFTGASRDFNRGALIVNPYSAEEVSEAIHRALVMPATEQHRRMRSMRTSIRDYNVYRWAAEFIKAVAALR
ncbi:MAG: trehalose 6-phosphate synthase [Parcubacteria group bacterium Gr01-1014_8]|nr:MAG: trehalose 6-phosphate synthase [Parcubacteria group bacterium Gr01-1014_8]